MGCDSPAHRLAPDAQHIPSEPFMAEHGCNDGPIASLEFFSAIRDATPLFGVKKIKGHDVHTTDRKTGCKPDDERARLVAPRAVGEHEAHMCPALR
jgi:hypothetical protein